MSKEGFFTKEQLASRFGISLATIDHYASVGLLNAFYSDSGMFFTATAFVRLELIEKGKRLGFSLNEIKALMDGHTY